jgi:hypothetical protein
MYVFIDESGTSNPSGQCVFVAVFIEQSKLAGVAKMVEVAEKIANTRTFHWRGKSRSVRAEFVRNLSWINFSARYVCFGNPLTSYSVALESLITTTCVNLDIKKIIIDGRKGKLYERNIKKVLRDKGVSTKKLRTAADEAYPGLRIADALAGLIRMHVNKPNSTTEDLMITLRKRGRI